MDATTQAFVTEIVSRKIAENWLYWLLFLAASFLAAFAGAYIKRRAENLATRDDFDELKRQLQQTTRLTEEIKSEVSHTEWKARETNSLMRAKLEEFALCISSSDQAFSTFVRKSCGGEFLTSDAPDFDRLRAIATLYFPSFTDVVEAYSVDASGTMIWAMERAIVVSNAKQQGTDEFAREMRNNLEAYKARIPPHNALRKKLEAMAAEEMKSLLSLPVQSESHSKP